MSALALKSDSKTNQRLHAENDFLNGIFDKELRKNLNGSRYILDSFHAFGNSVHGIEDFQFLSIKYTSFLECQKLHSLISKVTAYCIPFSHCGKIHCLSTYCAKKNTAILICACKHILLNKSFDALCWIQIQNHKSDSFSYCSSILASIRKRTKNLINVMLRTENEAYHLNIEAHNYFSNPYHRRFNSR